MSARKLNEAQKDAFRRYADHHAPRSPLFKDCTVAFLAGGAICLLGELIGDGYRALGVEEETVKTLISVTLIALSCLFTAIGLYDKLAKYAGAGTLVPITGFANAVCSCAVDSKAEGFILGVGAKMFTIAGPVLVYGTAASVVYGICYWIF